MPIVRIQAVESDWCTDFAWFAEFSTSYSYDILDKQQQGTLIFTAMLVILQTCSVTHDRTNVGVTAAVLIFYQVP